MGFIALAPNIFFRTEAINPLHNRYLSKIRLMKYTTTYSLSNSLVKKGVAGDDEDFLSHDSAPYNPLIANVLYNSSYIENWGSGVSRIITACRKANLAEPQWSTNAGFVVVTFYRPISDATTEKTTETILKQIQANPNITT